MSAYEETLSALSRADDLMRSDKNLVYRQREAARQVAVAQVYATLWVGSLLALIVDGERSIAVDSRHV